MPSSFPRSPYWPQLLSPDLFSLSAESCEVSSGRVMPGKLQKSGLQGELCPQLQQILDTFRVISRRSNVLSSSGQWF